MRVGVDRVLVDRGEGWGRSISGGSRRGLGSIEFRRIEARDGVDRVLVDRGQGRGRSSYGGSRSGKGTRVIRVSEARKKK